MSAVSMSWYGISLNAGESYPPFGHSQSAEHLR
jgi:hypothetical protein